MSNNQPDQNSQPQLGNIKVDVFKIDQDLKGLMDQLRDQRESLTSVFDQTRKAVMLLADLYGGGRKKDEPEIDMHLEKFEEAGVDIALTLRNKISEQSKYIDAVALQHGIKSNLAEQFTHYDDRHTGAEAKNELLEDIETQLMSVIYNQINVLRSKIDQGEGQTGQAQPPAPNAANK